ncbi:hypothetical protein [Tessaracoccus caeni]|uniref:hypothetical protein n=1 Tax=Tessaracoccus caeni TaxID=3031239 RepID=UPI0023DC8832|nr:hypothetical protein [Tessaracoccus caeni]MDF1488143.1 hypothetical protein [Tessaracoccus caeni]
MKRKIIAAVASAALALTGLVAAPTTASADTETTKVRIMLQGHDNDDLNLREGTVSVYKDGSWQQVTGTNPNNRNLAQVELAPGTYSIAVEYNGTRAQKQVTVGSETQTVYFGSALVKLDLRDSKGKPLSVDATGASYYANGWRTFDPEAGVELQPGTYSFVAVYNGTRQQKSFTVVAKNANNGANKIQTVDFKTSLVNVMLQGHTNGALDLREGSASYYANGWRAITGKNVNNGRIVQAEMLPGTYSFAVTWNGTRDQLNSVVVGESAKTVYFHAALVTTSLIADGEVVDPSEVSSSYYAGSWRAIGAEGVQMLPGEYSFAVVKDGVRQQQKYTVIKKNPNNGANKLQTVEFVR